MGHAQSCHVRYRPHVDALRKNRKEQHGPQTLQHPHRGKGNSSTIGLDTLRRTRMSRTLIRGGYIISMDPDLGDIDGGDVLIEDDQIVVVGKYIPASDAQVIDATGQIVAPGLIDTHKHTWQTLLRGLGYDTSTIAYLARVRFGLSRAYSPADISLGNRLGALEALNSGVTTILDFSHSINTH